MARSVDDVKKMILQEFNSRTNDSVRGKIDFTKHADVLDGIARTYMYYARNFPDKIDSSKIDGSDRFGRVLNKSVPDNMADLYLGRLLLNLLEIGETTESKGLCENNGIFFDKSSMDRQIKYWKKDVSFSKQDLDILKNNENMVTKNLNDKIVIHELSHMSAIFHVTSGAGFYAGVHSKANQTYASRLEEICAESTALNVTHQKIPSMQRIKGGNDYIKIGCYNPESSNFAISSFIELAPFAFGYKELEMGRLMSPVSYMESLNAEYSAFARSGDTFAGRIQEDFKAITDNREYGRLSKLQADFIKIGMTRISNQNYLNTCSENQFKRDVGYLLKVDNLLFRFYENNQLRQTENIDTYNKAMVSIENIFNNLKSNRNMFANYTSFDEFKQEGLLAFANERRVALGLSPVMKPTQPTSQPQGNQNQSQTTTSRPAMPPTPQSQSGNKNTTYIVSHPSNDVKVKVDTNQNSNTNIVQKNTFSKYSYETIDISTEKVGEVNSKKQFQNARYVFVYESMKNLFDECINPHNSENIEMITRVKRVWNAMAHDNGMRVVRPDGKKKSVMDFLREYYSGDNGFDIKDIPSTILSNPEIPQDVKSLFEDLYITKGFSGMADIIEVDFSTDEISNAYSQNTAPSSSTIQDYFSQFYIGDMPDETRKYLRDKYNFYGGKAGVSFEDRQFYEDNQEYLLKYLTGDLEQAKQRNEKLYEDLYSGAD